MIMAEAPDKMIINVQFNVPRYVVTPPGKQNRACTGYMRITPGISEPLEFQYVNTDGVPINLSGFKLLLVFWFAQNEYELLPANLTNNILLAKYLHIDDPYEGKCTVVLSDQETLKLAQTGHSSIRWSIYMISIDDENTYATQITS